MPALAAAAVFHDRPAPVPITPDARGAGGEVSLVGTVLATFGFCVLSAVIPFLNAELYLLAASALAPRSMAVALVVAASLGQMAGKTVMYFAGRGAVRLPGARLRRMVAAAQARYAQHDTRGREAVGGAMILVSAFVGLPPFYVVSVACGMLRVPFVQFFALGLVGRLARFGVIVLAPQLVKAWRS